MPKRTDIKKVLVIGSGPIIIGQACEFDYSGTQACKALREEGYEIVLVNSNPATIMTDPEIADATYIEPLTVDSLELIIAKEKPDALLPTIGGQTALNLAIELFEKGILEKYGTELIGASIDAIKKAEDRELFKQAMNKIGLEVPKSIAVNTLDQGLEVIESIGFPAILRPAFTLGGTGGGIAYDLQQFTKILEFGLELSLTRQVLVEESVLGWKEYEMEVVRDKNDNVIIICSVENFDPMGIHTGDSITVAPVQTLTDREYHRMRDASIRIIREIGVDTGGSNIQFAINPENGKIVVIEMNPRVSRSSALASKATGFPIAKIAAKLAAGLTLDEIRNDITRETPASFEPSIDYVVLKFPKFAFEKFPGSDPTLMTQMKSVGEVMAIGRTFKEALNKSIRSLEMSSFGFERRDVDEKELEEKLIIPNSERMWFIGEALRRGKTIDEISIKTGIDRWFIFNISEIIIMEDELYSLRKYNEDSLVNVPTELLWKVKEYGISDKRIAWLLNKTENEVRTFRKNKGVLPVYKMVDTCAGEFKAYTPYYYSTYEKPYFKKGSSIAVADCEAAPTNNKKVIILGSGPNRIGQGIEFDYCCVHAVMACKEMGYESIMINCNPETVSTDYDTADKLYFEPLTEEDVLNIIEKEQPEGVVLQFGGQTPLKLAKALESAGVKIFGTTPDAIDMAEDRKRFKELLHKLDLMQPESAIAVNVEEAVKAALTIGFPVLVRPSYVLGGRAMEIVYDEQSIVSYMKKAIDVSPDHPILIDKYLEDAIEVDVDCISDGYDTMIAGVMEHIEEAGIHSGDSACSLPPFSLKTEIVDEIKFKTKALAKEIKVHGLMNVQFAIKNGEIYVLEANPRASRTIPFVGKVTGIPYVKLATKAILGKNLAELNLKHEIEFPHIAVKEAVFPFNKFPGVDLLLGPEMRSTGEVMGIDKDFGIAFAKAQMASHNRIPEKGRFFISVKDKDKPQAAIIAKRLVELGMEIVATKGTAKFFSEQGIKTDIVKKVAEGTPNIVDQIKNMRIDFVINTVTGKQAQSDSFSIRRSALQFKVPYTTTITGAKAVLSAIENLKNCVMDVKSIQEYHLDVCNSDS